MGASQKYSTFYLNGICFGVAVERVQEVMEFQEITAVPLAPAALPGIINLRGQIIATIDLKTRLELCGGETAGPAMMIVLRTSEGPMNLVVDRIGNVIDVDPEQFEKPTETLKPAVRAATTHVCKLEDRLLLVLDTEEIIRLPEEREESGISAT